MIYSRPLALIPLLTAPIAALSVTRPQKGDKLDFNQANTIEWSSEDSDPEYISITLSNEDHLLSININIAENVSSSDESYTFNDVKALPGSGYVVNLKDASNGDIQAQSGEFSVATAGNSNVTSSSDNSTSGNSTSQDDDDNAAGRLSILPAIGTCSLMAILAFGLL
ncbi:hypothetical protein BJX65DRAFT_312106 [Aspergillus insuetus]